MVRNIYIQENHIWWWKFRRMVDFMADCVGIDKIRRDFFDVEFITFFPCCHDVIVFFQRSAINKRIWDVLSKIYDCIIIAMDIWISREISVSGILEILKLFVLYTTKKSKHLSGEDLLVVFVCFKECTFTS